MTAADFAAMADPERNRQFSRRWNEPAGSSPRIRRPPRHDDPLTALGRTLRDEFRGVQS
jgi:hypothetical protein